MTTLIAAIFEDALTFLLWTSFFCHVFICIPSRCKNYFSMFPLYETVAVNQVNNVGSIEQ
uniref:Uncharacterized protein n=1 Tax=Anguilla anguilla TaxID=7936 RepID=A0A0E9WI15_ANGAN